MLEDLVEIPKFAQYRQSDSYEAPVGKAQFTINEREQRMKLWIKDNFILNSENLNPNQLRYSFVNPNNQRLNILMQNGQVLIESDSIKVGLTMKYARSRRPVFLCANGLV